MNFFSSHPNNFILHEFDIMHLFAIAFFAAAVLFVFWLRKKFASWKHEKSFRYTITILAIALEIAYKIWSALTEDVTFLQDFLPLDLCAISLYLCWVLMFTKKRWIFQLIYFYSLGAMVSLFVPDLGGYGIDHFRYYHYFYVHGYIVFTSFYFVFVHKYKIKLKDLLRATVLLLIIAALVLLVDYLADANYMFLMSKPEVGSPLDLFGPWPKYVFAMIGVVIGVFILAYVPWIFANRKPAKEKNIIE
ncbi:MAG: TIGR02206 family membrane protein [Eubacteriales bacterium]